MQKLLPTLLNLKKYVTNSPKVCGDKLCEEELDTSIPNKKNMHTPLVQFYFIKIPY